MRDIDMPPWSPSALRYVVIGLVAPPALGKFLTYGTSVTLFRTLGIPAPETMVLLVGVLELGAVALLLLDDHRVLAALLLGPVVGVAAWTAGEWQAIAVLVALAGLVAIDLDILYVAPAGAGPDQPNDDST